MLGMSTVYISGAPLLSVAGLDALGGFKLTKHRHAPACCDIPPSASAWAQNPPQTCFRVKSRMCCEGMEVTMCLTSLVGLGPSISQSHQCFVQLCPSESPKDGLVSDGLGEMDELNTASTSLTQCTCYMQRLEDFA